MKNEILLLVFSCMAVCYAQNVDISVQNSQCILTAECIPLKTCPHLLKKILSKNKAQINETKNAICRYVNEIAYVCCDKKPITDTEETAPSATPIDEKNLLPKFCGIPETHDRIHGGKETGLGSHPWIAALAYSSPGSRLVNFLCAGSIISPRYVLTAAHCLVDTNSQLNSLNLGDWDLSNPDNDCQETKLGLRCSPEPHLAVGFDEIIIHENYNKSSFQSDDIALIRLDRDLDFRDNKMIQPVCLPPANFNISAVPEVIRPVVVGWGATEHRDEFNNEIYSDVLLSVRVPLVNNQLCADILEETITVSQICAGGEKGLDSCSGDSGGPLLISGEFGPPFVQIGVVSYGNEECGSANIPGVYTAVSKYRKWIENNIRP